VQILFAKEYSAILKDLLHYLGLSASNRHYKRVCQVMPISISMNHWDFIEILKGMTKVSLGRG